MLVETLCQASRLALGGDAEEASGRYQIQSAIVAHCQNSTRSLSRRVGQSRDCGYLDSWAAGRALPNAASLQPVHPAVLAANEPFLAGNALLRDGTNHFSVHKLP